MNMKTLSGDEISDYLNLLCVIPYAIQIVEDGFITYCNEATLKMFDIKEFDGIVGKPLTVIFHGQQHDGTISADLYRSYIDKAESGEAVTFFWTHQSASGDFFRSHVTMQDVIFHGKTCLMVTESVSELEPQSDLTDTKSGKFQEESLKSIYKCLESIASGDLSYSISIPALTEDSGEVGKQIAELSSSLDKARNSINNFVHEISSLMISIKEGKLDLRADPASHLGEFNTLIESINNGLDTVIIPFHTVSEYVGQISMGDIPSQIEHEFPGDLNIIRTNVNKCIDEINSLVWDTVLLSGAAVKGNLSIRLNPEDHAGQFGMIVEGINNTLDSITNPLIVTADYLSRIAKGDIPEKITDIYEGEFNEIKNNLNTCIESINALIWDTILISEAAVKGNLKVRVDSLKHQGNFRDIVEGINNTLDAVINPLKTAADYVNRISKGDMPPHITEEFNGDFNEIKTNLNICIDSINRLIADAGLMADAALNGILDTRCDEKKHQGDFRKIVEGINRTLDHFIWPIRESSRICKEYAVCNFSARVNKNLQFAGELIPFRDSLDGIGIQMQQIIEEINRVATSYAAGNFSTKINTSHQIKGDIIPLRDALDRIGNDISDLLKATLTQIDDLTKHANSASSGVADISSGANLIAQNADITQDHAGRSKDGMNQLLRTMEDLTKTVNDISDNIEQVSKLTISADSIAQSGFFQANKAEKGMAEISRSSEMVMTLISEVKNEMQEIGKIVRLITDIASQTNLLALNAAIEAARAGEAGRGFAVVAAEVKSLAQDSRKSADNISEMISGLQNRTARAVEAMANADSAVKSGNMALSETISAFQSLTGSVSTIKERMEVVASASEEQAASFEEITANVSTINHHVDETAKQALNSSATSEEALAMVSQIQSIIEDINQVSLTISKNMSRFSIR